MSAAKNNRRKALQLQADALLAEADDSLVAAMTDRLLPNELARKRNIAALSAELGQSTADRKARLRLAGKHDGRPGIDDSGGWSGSSWEE